MANKRNFKDYIVLFIKGIAMGTANKVPGISGGMVALVTQFYEEFIYSLQKFNLKAFYLLRKRGWRVFLSYTNTSFLFSILGGAVFSYFTASLILDWFIVNYEYFVWAFFLGMIIGSVYYVAKKITHWNKRYFALALISFLIGLSLTWMDPLAENRNPFVVFLCGIISVSGMTLPGLSGSFILILLGNYKLLIVDTVNNLAKILKQLSLLDFSFLTNVHQLDLLYILFIFVTGSVVGMISLSHLLGYLLKYFHDYVIVTLTGFILGSCGAVWPWRKPKTFMLTEDGFSVPLTYEKYMPNSFNAEVFLIIVFFVLGLTIVLLIAYLEKRRKKRRFS